MAMPALLTGEETSIIKKEAPPLQPVLNDNYGHPISSDLRLAGAHILRLETERLRHLNASSKKLSFFS